MAEMSDSEKLAERERELAEERRAAVAYARDRAAQYDRNSGCTCALENLASDLSNGVHRDAAKHGELDDLMSDAAWETYVARLGRERNEALAARDALAGGLRVATEEHEAARAEAASAWAANVALQASRDEALAEVARLRSELDGSQLRTEEQRKARVADREHMLALVKTRGAVNAAITAWARADADGATKRALHDAQDAATAAFEAARAHLGIGPDGEAKE